MGALFFAGLMFVLFCAGVLLAVINIILVIIWKVKKSKGKAPKKRWLVIPVVVLIIGILMTLVPVGFVTFLRFTNAEMSSDIVMVESGRVVYWGTDENGDASTENFIMDGITYVDIGYGASEKWEVGEPVANIRFESDEHGINKFMNTMFNYDGTNTIYPVKNNCGTEIYTLGSYMYCPEEDVDKVMAYYEDFSNYDTGECLCQYHNSNQSYDDSKGWPSSKLKLDNGIFEQLEKLSAKVKAVEIAVPEEGYLDMELFITSIDKVKNKQVWMALIGNQLYVIDTIYYDDNGKDDMLKAYPLTDELNTYMLPKIPK